MDNAELAKMTGQAGTEAVKAYKLNEVKMSGDDGKFSLREILGEKGADGKYPVKEMGSEVDGVILKSRWRLTRYEEVPGGKPHMWMTSEYDNKNTDRVIEFSTKEKGTAINLKEKYNLGSQRVLYVYLPTCKEVVRIIVKASALSGEKNPEEDGVKPLGLFEYVDQHNETKTMLHEYITAFGSIFREDKNNKRKSYYAMTFKAGRVLTDSEKEKMVGLIQEIYAKTSAAPGFADEWKAPEETTEAPKEDITADDIPF